MPKKANLLDSKDYLNTRLDPSMRLILSKLMIKTKAVSVKQVIETAIKRYSEDIENNNLRVPIAGISFSEEFDEFIKDKDNKDFKEFNKHLEIKKKAFSNSNLK